LPFRLNLEGGTWSDLVKQAFEAERAALPFRRYPMAELQRKHGAQPLFESIFNYTNYHVYKALEGLGKQALVKADFIEQTNFPLSAYFDLDASSSNLALSLHYHPDKFPGEQIEATLKYYTEVLKAMASDPQARYESVGLLPEWEQRLLLGSWNDNYAGHSLERCAHHLFEAQCERTPGAIAAAFKGEQLTYGELNRRANQLAHRLTGLGVGPEILAGIYVERSLEMVVAMLGILKAGGAYVPLDPDYPRDRLAFMLEDARLAVIVTQERLADRLPESRAEVLYLDRDRDSLSCESEANPVINVTAANVAYTIYTSGSTGKPKGVMITHRSVVNFFAGMDRCVEHDRPGVWLAVTSISFDISVLELMWTLSRGFKVVIQSDGEAVLNSFTSSDGAGAKGMDFSLFYFASDDTKPNGDKYKLLLEGARFADRNGFSAIWTPERHFHAFGGIYPNPSVTSAAIASITERVQIRAGSVVLPLHDPIRVAEEWAVVDNISNGRVGISFASGWHANDFVLAPESYSNRKELMFSKIKTVQKLWKGEPVTFPDSHGNDVEIKTLPRPVQPELPTWITAAGNPETFQMAGEIGANVLTHLLGQSIDELAERISLYRSAWRQSGEREGN
ncbi:MAG TPA: MupA/Atu3671 family FMN-dependent luciferase-like monooxygenase, partial [Blastocatellia bacterium]